MANPTKQGWTIWYYLGPLNPKWLDSVTLSGWRMVPFEKKLAVKGCLSIFFVRNLKFIKLTFWDKLKTVKITIKKLNYTYLCKIKQNFFVHLSPTYRKIQKRMAILLYLFWNEAPLSVLWTEVPILWIKLSMHLTLKETKLKLELQS